jgi:murein DD-endopeptidase MepM/ murein hydrolase activator NlpD
MTKTARHFPATVRSATVAALLIFLSVAGTIAGAAPSKQDVERAKEKIRNIEGQLGAIREDLASTQLRLNAAADRVEEHEIALEEVEVDLARTREALDRAKARYQRIVDRLNERAVEAYIQGPATSIDFLLGSQTIADLTDRLAYVDALAQSDADLSVRVANLKNRLTVIQGQLEEDQARQRRRLDAARVQEEQVLGLFQDVQRLLDRQQGLLASAERIYRKRKAAYADFLERQRSAQGSAMGGRVWNGGDLPEPYNDVLTVCPVAQPRAFGDGFGAPRYAGGYHLHKGVDLVAPAGTAILAAFDGYAYTSANSLGGNVVFVVGQYGRVYNAHLSRYSENSNGRVSAGDVIGYVGDTGDATGLPHDHFEFHPNAMPGAWPASYYGYSVIEDAINPYPLLIQACG